MISQTAVCDLPLVQFFPCGSLTYLFVASAIAAFDQLPLQHGNTYDLPAAFGGSPRPKLEQHV